MKSSERIFISYKNEYIRKWIAFVKKYAEKTYRKKCISAKYIILYDIDSMHNSLY